MIPFARKEAVGEESKWETIGGVRIRRPNTELQKSHMLQGDNTSVYGGEMHCSLVRNRKLLM